LIGWLNKGRITHLEKSNLKLGVGADPEVGSKGCPHSWGEVELEEGGRGGEGLGTDGEVVWSDDVESEAAES